LTLLLPLLTLARSQEPYNGEPLPIADFAASLIALVERVGAPVYLDRRVAAFEGGFIEQNTSQLAHPRAGSLHIEACLVAHTNAEGKITLLEEYLDPSTAKPAPKL